MTVVVPNNLSYDSNYYDSTLLISLRLQIQYMF